jgi:hypothetical protein
MAEVEEECVFCTRVDQVRFRTRTNGDEIRILNLRLPQAKAASMAWLVNHQPEEQLEFQIKVKGT